MTSVEHANGIPVVLNPHLQLAELNHRVSNEFAAALAALRCAKRPSRIEERDAFLDAAISRLEGFAAVHRMLMREHEEESVTSRLATLCRAASRWGAESDTVNVCLHAEDIELAPATAWAMLVIASELLTNALRHAFPEGRCGIIEVGLARRNGLITLTVADNGQGRVEPKTVRSGGGLGTRIIAELADQHAGWTTRTSGPEGTTVRVLFPEAVSAIDPIHDA